MKNLFFLSVLTSTLIFTGCAHKSLLEVAESDKGRHIFQYCGGHQWGFSQKLGTDQQSPYLFVFLESDFLEQADLVMANVLIHTTTDTDLKINGQDIILQRDGKPVTVEDPNFWLIWGQPDIYDQFNYSDYNAKQISPTEWEVGKIKYWGWFGRTSIEEPMAVKLEKAPNEQLRSESNHVALDPKKGKGLFFLRKTVVKFDGPRPADTKLTIQVPAFEVNGIQVPSDIYTLNYSRSRIESALKLAENRCGSPEEIVRAERNKDSWIWFMYPRIK
jgi:hypothetical protein